MGETLRDGGKGGLLMAHALNSSSMMPAHVGQETLYVGVDIGKQGHVGGFLSTTLLARHRRFEHCPALSFANSREGFHALLERIQVFVPLTQVQSLVEVTGHYHRALMQYLQDLGIPVYVIHVQKRPAGLLKTDKRDALNRAEYALQSARKGHPGERAPPGGAPAPSFHQGSDATAGNGSAPCRTRPGVYSTQKQANGDLR
jgi:hypothetical protein